MNVPYKSLKTQSRLRHSSSDSDIYQFSKRTWSFVSEETISLVKQFFIENSIELPFTTSTRIVRDNGVKVIKQKRVLDFPLDEFHKHFRETYPDNPISYSFFTSLRPVNVYPRKSADQCVCYYHMQMKYLFEAQQKCWVSFHENCPCKAKKDECHFCHLFDCDNVPKLSLDKLYNEVLCDPPNLSCVIGNCPSCSVSQKLGFCTSYEDYLADTCTDSDTTWPSFIDTTTNGVNIRHIVNQKTSKETLYFKFFDHFKPYLLHNYVKLNQKSVYERIRDVTISKELNQATLLLTIDFGANLTHHTTQMLQSEYFLNKQTTLAVVCAYFVDKIICKGVSHTFIFLSDYLQHDSLFTQKMITKSLSHLFAEYPDQFKFVHIFSDGASAHFKQKTTLFYISKIKNLFPSIESASWNFYASHHGKGKHDVEISAVKRYFESLFNSGVIFNDCSTAASHLSNDASFCDLSVDETRANISTTRKRYVFTVNHQEILTSTSSESSLLKSIEATKTNHFYATPTSSLDRNSIFQRVLSCACEYCLSGKYSECIK